MRLDRGWIEANIPHRGRMCLLDEVIDWDAARIRCRSVSHRAVDHPLRAHGRLGVACGIEYAAQAMAVHGALASGALDAERAARAPPAGFLASVRNLQFFASRLDDVSGDLLCDAVRMAGDARTALYEFEVRSASAALLRGRATVVLDANERALNHD